MSEPKYPDVFVQLSGEDGNAFFIMGRVSRAMKKAGCSQEDVNEYMDAAMSSDYSNLLRTTAEYVSIA